MGLPQAHEWAWQQMHGRAPTLLTVHCSSQLYAASKQEVAEVGLAPHAGPGGPSPMEEGEWATECLLLPLGQPQAHQALCDAQAQGAGG